MLEADDGLSLSNIIKNKECTPATVFISKANDQYRELVRSLLSWHTLPSSKLLKVRSLSMNRDWTTAVETLTGMKKRLQLLPPTLRYNNRSIKMNLKKHRVKVQMDKRADISIKYATVATPPRLLDKSLPPSVFSLFLERWHSRFILELGLVPGNRRGQGVEKVSEILLGKSSRDAPARVQSECTLLVEDSIIQSENFWKFSIKSHKKCSWEMQKALRNCSSKALY